MAVSTIRAMKGTAAMVSGTMAAAVPMEVPATRRVKGMIATTRMMKGVERVAFTISPATRLKVTHCNSSPRPLVASSTPRGRPKSVTSKPAIAVICRICRVASPSSAEICGEIPKWFNNDILILQEADHGSQRVARNGDSDHERAERGISNGIHLSMQDRSVDAMTTGEAGNHRRLRIVTREAKAQYCRPLDGPRGKPGTQGGDRKSVGEGTSGHVG